MTADQAKAAAEMMAAVWEGEFPATCQVLAAVNDGNREYKPDAKSRTAWQLATHLATADVWFVESITNGAFVFNPEQAKKAEAQFTQVSDLLDFYKKTFPEKLNALRALPADKMTENIDFFGIFNWPRARWIGEGAEHLRSERRRGNVADAIAATDPVGNGSLRE
jgi:hypothetical protein